MVKMTFNVSAEESTADKFAPSDAPAYRYSPLEPGVYTAELTKLEEKKWRAAYGVHKNPDSKDVKWTYLSVRPHFKFTLNTGIWVLNRQDFTVGVVNEDDELIRVQNDGKSPLFGGQGGARFLLKELWLFDVSDGVVRLDLETEIIEDRMIKILVGTGGYIKETGQSYSVDELQAWLEDRTGRRELTIDEIYETVSEFNEENDYPEDGGMRLKNIVLAVYSLKQWDAEANGWYFDPVTRAVFTTEAAYDNYVALSNLSDNGEAL
jgi:hypothetical protein